jgi:hypothetical protein
MRIHSKFACALSVLMAWSAFAQEENWVARIGDKTLSVRQFEERARELKQTGYNRVSAFDADGKRTLLDGIIARELLVMEGVNRGYDRDSTIVQTVEKSERKALMMELYEREAVQPSYDFTDEQLRTFFHEHQYDIEVLSQHIVCPSEDRALQALTELNNGAPFESLVATYSTQNIVTRFGPKGWVGWFKIGDVLEPLKEPLRTMPVGSLFPRPVETAMGFHVFRLQERRPIEFADARESIQKQALVQYRADDMERYIQALRVRYELRCDMGALSMLTSDKLEERPLCSWRGGTLTNGDYMRAANTGSAHDPRRTPIEQVQKDADNLAGRQIMLAEARALGLHEDEKIRRKIDGERDKMIVGKVFRTEVAKRVTVVSDEQVRAFYEANREEFTREDGKVTAFDFLRESIRTAMQERAQNDAMDQLLAELRQTFADQIEISTQGLNAAFAE